MFRLTRILRAAAKKPDAFLYKQYIQTQALLRKHNHLYYLGTPEISDPEYDTLFKNLLDLERQYPELMQIYQDSENQTSMSQKVGYSMDSNDENTTGEKIVHQTRMLSLVNTYNRDELAHFIDKVQQSVRSKNVNFTIEKKFDGMALSLLFDINGFLIRAVTRGDGIEGEDVTNPIIQHVFGGNRHDLIKNIFGTTIEIRGEVIMNKDTFNEINKSREKEGKETFRNPRNLVAGICRKKKIEERYPCEFMAYSLFIHSNQPLETELPDSHYKQLDMLRKMGLKTDSSPKISSSISDIFDTITELEKNRDNLKYEIDGVVVKVDSITNQKKLGEIARAPRWAIAYKFEARKSTTKLLDIAYQVGRTGKIVPVALLEPVEIGGVVISRATLHNFQYIHQNQLVVGDQVLIERAADVIPKVTSIHNIPRDNFVFHLPKVCPCEIKSPLVAKGADIWCIEAQCPQQLHRGVQHFVSKSALNIKGLAGSIIQNLLDERMISSIPDIFRLHERRHEIIKLRGWKDKKLENILTEIEKAKNCAYLERLLNGLGICGKEQAYLLTSRYKSIEDLFEVKPNDLMSIEGIGTTLAHEITSKLQKARPMIEELQSLGIPFNQLEINKKQLSFNYSSEIESSDPIIKPQVLKGKNIVVSGSFKLFPHRDNLISEIEEHGGSIKNTLSRKVDYFVIGERCGPKKIEQARSFDVRVIDEATFVANFLPGWRSENEGVDGIGIELEEKEEV